MNNMQLSNSLICIVLYGLEYSHCLILTSSPPRDFRVFRPQQALQYHVATGNRVHILWSYEDAPLGLIFRGPAPVYDGDRHIGTGPVLAVFVDGHTTVLPWVARSRWGNMDDVPAFG